MKDDELDCLVSLLKVLQNLNCARVSLHWKKKKLLTYLSAIQPFVNVKHSIYSERIEMAFYIRDTCMKFNTEINLMRKRLKRLHGTRSNAYCND